MEKQDNFNEYAFSLIIEEFEGDISQDRKRELLDWRQASAENEKNYQEFYSVKSEIDSLAEFRKINENDSWNKVNAQLENRVISLKDGFETNGKISNRKSYSWIYGLAASIILVIGLFIFKPTKLDTLETADKGHKRIVLPDGSYVALNEQTRIEYNSSDFANNRELTLIKGEAYFQVVHNSRKPFRIKAGETAIEDLGTTFTVTKSKESVKVLVSSGKVALKALTTGESKVISAGRLGVYPINDKVITDTPDTGLKQMQWLNNQLTFVNTDLSDIVGKLKSIYGKDIIIKDSSLKHRRLTAPLAYQTVDSALSVISASLQVRVSRSGSAFVISK